MCNTEGRASPCILSLSLARLDDATGRFESLVAPLKLPNSLAPPLCADVFAPLILIYPEADKITIIKKLYVKETYNQLTRDSYTGTSEIILFLRLFYCAVHRISLNK